MNGFDALIHQPTRLQIVAMLAALDEDGWLDFTFLKKELSLTDGNLGAQLAKLEEAGYLSMKKKFVAKRPKTSVQLTARGRRAFDQHREALKAIMDSA